MLPAIIGAEQYLRIVNGRYMSIPNGYGRNEVTNLRQNSILATKTTCFVIAALAGSSIGSSAWALVEESVPPDLSQIVVVGTTPVPGMTVDADKVPANLQTLSAADLRQDGTSRLINALSTRLSSVSSNDPLADPFQPDILYRGFEASPVLGTPQGLAVYQNGVRINEAFGDTVNWDLFPNVAIDEVELSGGAYGQHSVVAQFGMNSGPFGVYVAAQGLDWDGWRQYSDDRIRTV